MAFCSFSKDFDGNSYVSVENKFITKYLPEADGFAVKVYLYGLFLCQKQDVDFSVRSMAEVLKCSESDIESAFTFWQDYDLVEILSKDPFAVQYLPVRTAVGRPKKVKYEQYADFNKELQRKMSRVGKFVSAGDYLKYMRFLEESSLQPQALLLIVEYCINKQGENVSPSYIFNKAKKLLRNGLSTYEQVENELSNYNAHEGDLVAVFSALGSFQKTPDESDYSAYRKWTETLGFHRDTVIAVAKRLKRGTIASLESTLEELYEKGKLEKSEVENYLTERETLSSLTFRIARKLGAKVVNPATYIDVYVEKWYNYGFDEESLLDIALFCLKTDRASFDSMDSAIERLFAVGVITRDGVKAFLKEKNDELKLFSKIQDSCGAIRKNSANISLIRTWRSWNFNDEMILEAAKRSATSANPVPYMNKILSDWKRLEIFDVKNIPENENGAKGLGKTTFVNPAVEAVNAKSDRERYYSLLREKAQMRADKFMEKAKKDARFSSITKELSSLEIELAKAEFFAPERLPALEEKKKSLFKERKGVLEGLGILEEDLTVKCTCKKCSDTGFLPSGKACDCYKA